MILALDLGSTSFKAAVFDDGLRPVSAGSGRVRHRFGAGGLVELDVTAVHAALRGALKAARVHEHGIRVIALTSQAQTFTWVDARGRATAPFISWQDTRPAARACAALERELKGFPAHCSFADLLPGLQVSHLRRLRPGGPGMPLLLPSYVLRLLTGESVTDDNVAAMGGLYSLAGRAWWPEALRACGLREAQLPRVIPIGGIATATTPAARRFGLPAGVPVVLAGNDQTAGGYAAAFERRGALLLTLGTAQVAYACRKTMPAPKPGTVRGPYPGGLFYRMAADNSGGNTVNWARTVIAGCADDKTFFAEAARAVPGCSGLVFEAGLDLGLGAWRNLGLHHTRADLARSVLECLSGRLAGLVKALGVPVKGRTVLAAGGGSRQELWRRIVAGRLGASLAAVEASPLAGAARMGLLHWPGETRR